MGLSLISRSPSFDRAYATDAEFAAAQDNLRTAAAMPVTSPSRVEVLRDSELRDALTRGRVPERFSSRTFAASLMKAAGAQIVSEHEGEITQLLLTVPRETRSPSEIDPLDARHFQALLTGLGRNVEYVIVCGPAQQRAIEGWLADSAIGTSQVRFVLSPVFKYTIWAQDAYVVLRDANGTSILCEGISFPRGEDMTIADDVAAQTDIASLQSYLYFQGGNVLGGSDVTLIGMDYVSRNVSRHRLLSTADVLAAFQEQFGTAVLPLGGPTAAANSVWWRTGVLSGYGFQPIFHIDMYVTPTGVRGQSGKPVVFLGRPARARQAVGRWTEVQTIDGAAYDAFFEATAAQLSEAFEVRLLPLWLCHGNLGLPNLPKRYYVLSWNNAVVQNGGSSKRVLLPYFADPDDCRSYGVDQGIRAALQDAAEQEWRSLGFEVDRMDGLEDLAAGLGSVHCITKALKRT